MGHLVGYARVSTTEQSVAPQVDELHAAGVERVWQETASGALAPRPVLVQLLDHVLQSGDTLVVVRLDRLGRSLRHLLQIVETLTTAGVGLRSLHEGIDTTTPAGRMALGIFGALAEFERDLIRERTRAGLAAAKTRGRHGGRPKTLTTAHDEQIRAHAAEGKTPTQIAQLMRVSRATIYRHMNPDTATNPNPGSVSDASERITP
jgi:DNA invertase Pin-like site-specific DNA recombinase